jgi:hypothetical protein
MSPSVDKINARTLPRQDGTVGKIYAGAPLLLLHTIGARSGRDRVSPIWTIQEDAKPMLSSIERAPIGRSPSSSSRRLARPVAGRRAVPANDVHRSGAPKT